MDRDRSRFVRLDDAWAVQAQPPTTPEALTAILRAHGSRIAAAEAAIMSLIVAIHRAGLIDVQVADRHAEALADLPLGEPLPGL